MKKLLYLLLSTPIFLFGQEQDPCYSINEVFTQMDMDNPQIEINLVSGWNMIGYPCTQEVIVSDAFSSIVNEITIVKNNSGSVYMPEFSFNGIGFLLGGQGYQIKMTDFVLGFTFCQSIQFPTLEGCTDCEASNFNKWANVDDGSCIAIVIGCTDEIAFNYNSEANTDNGSCAYDSDGDGVSDSEEVVGCQQESACDYDVLATDSAECSYPQDGFDCEGNLYVQVGDEALGGIVFYIDETSQCGLVWAIEDLGATYELGCYGVEIDGANSKSIGTGFQNTLDILEQDCETENGFINAAQAASEYENQGYSDWFLPSINELSEVYNSIIDIIDFDGVFNWSSSEDNINQVWGFDFNGNGNVGLGAKNGVGQNTRVIRAFGNWTMGCMDSLACNYNPDANMADGSCTYAEEGYDCEGNITAQIGDIMEGGYLFYLDETGQHGLVSAMEDLGDNNLWGCSNIQVQGANETSIGSGYQNTLDIVAECLDTPISASKTLAYALDGYDDWYLPSKNELIEMYNSLGNGSSEGNIGGFGTDGTTYYWSSSEANSNHAWGVRFSNGYVNDEGKASPGRVRPIRAFGNWTMGCMDSLACNYDAEANMADGSCTYSEQGYDCEGNLNPQVGDEAFGGIVFYVDETGQHGLVAAMEDLTEGATDPYGWGVNGYEWGCYQENVDGADGISIGTGYQNTMDIANNECISVNGGITAAQAALDFESEGYSDWYLPSKDELLEIYYTIGNGGPNGNIGDLIGIERPYWSSSEYDNNHAWNVYFDNVIASFDSNFYPLRVRTIRSF